MRVSLLMVGLFLVLGCSQQAKDLASLEAQCQNKMKKNEGFCRCLTAKAEKELSEQQIAFVAAGFEKDKKRIKSIKEQLGMEGIIATGIFMAKSVTTCKQQKTNG